jgi:hypothetical protein
LSKGEKIMSDDKVSVKEALEKLYDLSWMIGSTAVEYLTDRDGEKIRDYIGVIEDRINDLEKGLSEDVNKQILEEKVDNTRGTGLWQPGDED